MLLIRLAGSIVSALIFWLWDIRAGLQIYLVSVENKYVDSSSRRMKILTAGIH